MTVILLEETPAVLSVGKLCDDHGGKRINCNMSNFVPFVVPVVHEFLTTPTPTSSSSSSQDSVFDISRYTENPALERSGSMSEKLRGNPLHKPTETENKNRNEGLSHELPDFLQEFRKNLVDERSPLEPQANPESGHP